MIKSHTSAALLNDVFEADIDPFLFVSAPRPAAGARDVRAVFGVDAVIVAVPGAASALITKHSMYLVMTQLADVCGSKELTLRDKFH